MNVRVKLGTVRYNDRIFKVGEIVDLPEASAKAMLFEGVVEDMQMVAQVEEQKEEVKVEVKEEPKPEVETAEPSLDWTRKELNEFAVSKGVKEPEALYSKKIVLKAIKEVKQNEH